MKSYTAAVLINLGVLALTGLVFYWTRNWWSLIILLCMYSVENKTR